MESTFECSLSKGEESSQLSCSIFVHLNSLYTLRFVVIFETCKIVKITENCNALIFLHLHFHSNNL